MLLGGSDGSRGALQRVSAPALQHRRAMGNERWAHTASILPLLILAPRQTAFCGCICVSTAVTVWLWLHVWLLWLWLWL